MTASIEETSTTSKPRAASPSRSAALALLLILGTLLSLWPVLRCDFVIRDDDYTVSQNPLLTPPTIRGVIRYGTGRAGGLSTPVTYTVWSAVAMLSPAPVVPGQPYQLNP